MRQTILSLIFLSIFGLTSTGCAPMVRYASRVCQTGTAGKGVCIYVGGAGPFGHIGSTDVPLGLQDAGYSGFVDVFTWQGLFHAEDQMNLEKNQVHAMELADAIRDHVRQHPDAGVNIIALSAGTGIAAFALEYLPESIKVRNVVMLSSSLSSHYDLTRALKRIEGKLYTVYSPSDIILSGVVPHTGTVDRAPASEGLAGLLGFQVPIPAGCQTIEQYRKVHNIAYRSEFSRAGYGGGHVDSISRVFVRDYLSGAIMGSDRRLLGQRFPRPSALEPIRHSAVEQDAMPE